MAVADISRFQQVLAQAKSALIILPQNPDFDQVSSALSLSLGLKKKEIATTVVCPDPMRVEFNRLVGVNKIRQDLGDKNLQISFTNYPADNIERVSYNVDNGQFSLTVIPKEGNSAPNQDQVSLSYAGISSDMVVVVGANYPDGLGRFAENRQLLENQNLALLGNAPLAGWPRAIELIDASASCVSEVSFEVIEQMGVSLDADLATNLFLGIEAGTKNFTAPQTTAATFEKVAKLLHAGANRASPGATASGSGPVKPAQETRQTSQPPADWLAPKVYKGSNLG